ncbi:MAG: hypothetical protein JNN18_17920 [Rubrivivax sp.]|nr:hypothetical protein [Rubrivivax sp.]
MAQESLVRNPFMLMTNPEIVIAAIERSERLGQLNRHLCRPLDRPAANPSTPGGASVQASATDPSDDSPGDDLSTDDDADGDLGD